MSEPEQPGFSATLQAGVTRSKNYHNGSVKSKDKLRELRFDPIEELVKQYQALEAECAYQEMLRDGTVEELRSDGKPRAYRAEVHMMIYDKLIAIGDRLLRYGYGRVPETVIQEHKDHMPLVINLTAKGQKYVVNEDDDVPELTYDQSS